MAARIRNANRKRVTELSNTEIIKKSNFRKKDISKVEAELKKCNLEWV